MNDFINKCIYFIEFKDFHLSSVDSYFNSFIKTTFFLIALILMKDLNSQLYGLGKLDALSHPGLGK